MTLNEILSEMYHSEMAQTDQVASIIHFYTFLLLNCNNELVLCKIVSDSFVLELTEVYLDVVMKNKGSSRELTEVYLDVVMKNKGSSQVDV